MKADHPRAIDRYIDFFGGDTGMRLAARDTRTLATTDSRAVERRDLTASDDQPGRQRRTPLELDPRGRRR
jgi:hypothetical protein